MYQIRITSSRRARMLSFLFSNKSIQPWLSRNSMYDQSIFSLMYSCCSISDLSLGVSAWVSQVNNKYSLTEDMMDEMVLQFLVGIIYTKLREPVGIEILEPINIQNRYRQPRLAPRRRCGRCRSGDDRSGCGCGCARRRCSPAEETRGSGRCSSSSSSRRRRNGVSLCLLGSRSHRLVPERLIDLRNQPIK